MDSIVGIENLTKLQQLFTTWIRSDVFVWSNLVQFLVVAALFLVAKPIASRLRAWFEILLAREPRKRFSSAVLKNASKLTALTLPATWLLLLAFALAAYHYAEQNAEIIRIATKSPGNA